MSWVPDVSQCMMQPIFAKTCAPGRLWAMERVSTSLFLCLKAAAVDGLCFVLSEWAESRVGSGKIRLKIKA